MFTGISPSTLLGWLLTAGGIVLVDLSLSGDNALIIGAAASRLSGRQRTWALIWGGAGAIVARIVLTGVATELLRIPLLQTIGALIIMVITIRMLIPETDGSAELEGRSQSDRLWRAVLTILVADVSMSLDNILAIGALARGNLSLLALGLLLSMLLLLTASALIARIIERLPWLIDLTALILAYTAADLALQDPEVSGRFGITGIYAWLLIGGTLLFTLLVDIGFHIARGRRTRQTPAPTARPEAAPATDAREEERQTTGG
jgi:YjbE family integral membrane protein